MEIELDYEYSLWLDLDGVIADFETKVSEIAGLPFHSMRKSKIWHHVQMYNDRVKPFFQSLDKMKDADELLDWVITRFGTIKILSACGHTPKNAAEQKKIWVQEHIAPKIPHIVAKIVTSSEHKAHFATPTSILVDDRLKSITPWVAAGGIGVLHTSAKDTIAKLEEILSRK